MRGGFKIETGREHGGYCDGGGGGGGIGIEGYGGTRLRNNNDDDDDKNGCESMEFFINLDLINGSGWYGCLYGLLCVCLIGVNCVLSNLRLF